MKVFDRSRPGAAAGAVGVAQRALDESIRYAKERLAFGKPLWQHQVIGHMIADMAMNVEAARLLVWKCAADFDANVRNTTTTAFAKAFAADMAMKVDHRRRAGVRRLRLHVRVSGRKTHAGRQDLPDLRRNEPDPARDRGPRAFPAVTAQIVSRKIRMNLKRVLAKVARSSQLFSGKLKAYFRRC